jgi:hypothetical protein
MKHVARKSGAGFLPSALDTLALSERLLVAVMLP